MASAWPKDYIGELVRRAELEAKISSDPVMRAGALALYERDPVAFIGDCCFVFEPRNANIGEPVRIPVVPFPRQEDFIRWLHKCFTERISAPVEKSRDSGATWMASCFAVWLWRFHSNVTIGFGSRKEMYVDQLGDMDSIFEKIRSVIRSLPPYLMPAGLNESNHFNYMRVLNPENGSTIKGEAGDNIGRGGRAQPLGAKILTPTGWSTMGEMYVGREIIGANGKPTRVSGVFPQGVKAIYKVSFSDGSSTHCCASHLWQVTSAKQRKSIQRGFQNPYRSQHSVKSLAEIGMFLKVDRPDGQTQWQYQIPIVQPIEFAGSDEDLPLHPYVVGSLIGDGSISNIDRTAPSITSGDEETFDLIAERLPEGVVVRRYCRLTARLSYAGGNGKTAPGRHGPLKKALFDLGLAGKTAVDKFIPDQYKFSSVQTRLDVLRGLFDTDGWTTVRFSRGKGPRVAIGSKTGFCTISSRLRDDVIFLVQSLGGTANYHVKPPSKRVFPGGMERNTREAYELTITMPAGMCPHLLKRKRDNYVERNKYRPFRSIVAVDYVGEQEAQCITVEAEDHLYVTDDCIVTHNSAIYFVDESAFIERPKAVSAALSANTDCRIDISSSRAGTMFQTWCDTSGDKKFVFDVRDAPWHTEEWIKSKQEEFEGRGESELFAQEFLRDPTANIEGQLIKSVWIEAAIDADKKLAEKGIRIDVTGEWVAALDVADGGRDRNSLAIRHGIKLHSCKSRGDLLADGAGLWAYNEAIEVGVERLLYDSIGVGAGAAASLRGKKGIKSIQGWAASGEVVNPTAKYGNTNRTNADMFKNAKSQAWWMLRDKFLATFKAVRDGRVEDPDKLIILSSEIDELRELKTELAQITYEYDNSGKIVINKTPDGSVSPNRADSVMIVNAPRKVGVSIIGFM